MKFFSINNVFYGGINGLIFSFLGLLVAGGIFLILYVFKGLGAGDVKLFVAIVAIVGVQMVYT
ncbi:prepilin peptidase [Oceanobacillus limi]|uniref:prepilin peptidase n=1 Tax=Oceanobacillus limi TaxID=930131 RepID=UPI001FCD9117|nr:prepilin peptidase [Oceanobacillus limi]